MENSKVFSKYQDLLEKQINRLNSEFGENAPYKADCPVCVDEAFDISCQETLSTGTVTPLTSPRGIVTPQSEQTACSPESRHSPRHFDNFTQRHGTKGDLSMEQSCCVSTPCQASNACDGLPSEETTFLGSLFENHKYSDEHRTEIGKTMGFLNERKLNSEGPTNTDSKDVSRDEEGMLEIEGVDIFSNSSTDTTVSKDRAYRESSLSRMKCLTELRDKQRKEWTRDLKWLCEDVQDFTLASVDTTERQKILYSVRSRFSRLSKELNKLVQNSIEIGANRYHYENSKTGKGALGSPTENLSYRLKDINFAEEFNEPLEKCFMTASKVEQGMEFLRQKLELKYDLCKTADADTDHHDSVTMITNIPTMPKEDKAEKVSEGHCSDMNSPRIGYNKLAMDVDLMVKGVQRLKDFQENRSFPVENSIIFDKLSPRKEETSFVEDQSRMVIPAYDETSVSAFHEFTELDEDESNEEIHIQHKIPVTPKEVDIKNQAEAASVPSKLNSTENDYEDNDIPSRRSFPNRNVSQNPTFTSLTSPFLTVLMMIMIFIVCVITSITPKTCSVRLVHRAAPPHEFLHLSWTDGIPPL